MNLFGTLNSFENLFLKPESREKLALKTLAKIPLKWGLYRPNRKLAVRLIWQPDRLAVDRPGRPPTVRNMTVGQNRSTARSTPKSREQSSLARSTAQIQRARLSDPVDRSVDRPTGLPDVHILVHVGRPLGRPAFGSVDPAVDRLGLLATVWVRNWFKHILKNSFNNL